MEYFSPDKLLLHLLVLGNNLKTEDLTRGFRRRVKTIRL